VYFFIVIVMYTFIVIIMYSFCGHNAGYNIWRKSDEVKFFPELIPVLQCRSDLLRHILKQILTN
jgi:hypothetical protein